MKIELKRRIPHGKFKHCYYTVKIKDLTTIVSVLDFEGEPAFVHNISEGDHKLFQDFELWNSVRINVLKYHNKLKEKEGRINEILSSGVFFNLLRLYRRVEGAENAATRLVDIQEWIKLNFDIKEEK